MARRTTPAAPAAPPTFRERLAQLTTVVETAPPTLKLLWRAAPLAMVVLLLITLAQAVVPAAIAYVAKIIVDAVVAAQAGDVAARTRVTHAVVFELGLVVVQLVLARLQGLVREHVAARLKRSLSLQVIDKALHLELRHFEDSSLYDKMQNARREADRRPLSLAMGFLGVLQNAITLATYAALIAAMAPWALPVLFVAALPSFIAELRFAGESFRVMTWRAPEGRRLNYLEWVLTRDSTVKEVKLFGLGQLFLGRFTALFDTMIAQDLKLARGRALWGALFGVVAVGAFYGCYVVVADHAAAGAITLGDMTLALAAFRQGQTAFQAILTAIGGMVEDALFMSNLFAYLEVEAPGEQPRGAAQPLPPGPQSLVLDHVTFAYPGSDAVVLDDVSITIAPGEKIALVGENGAGKSTIVKLLLRLYEPTQGAIRFGDVDLRDADPAVLRRRFSAVFQDYVRYQLIVGENVGVGDVDRLAEPTSIDAAIGKAGAADVVDKIGGHATMLGGWFEEGRELSGGQWQKLALARGFMRADADVLILDEPTAAVDAKAEADLFSRIQELAKDKTAILISHRFSTVRMADRILVLEGGRIVEQGSHDELVALNGKYATLFALQAKGYR
ncbi:MAG TPA: ABC transporter ATP-binding protein [Myxococcota bacterium]